MEATRVAFDIGPLAGQRTGVGIAVAALREALQADPEVTLVPYMTSFRAPDRDGVRRLPVPAAIAHRMWRHAGRPRADRWLGEVDVVHGTNYVVPPSRRPRLVSVYDCWFLHHPDQASPDVRRAGAVLCRAIERGAVVHASSAATGSAIQALYPSARVEVIHLAATALPPPATTAPVAELEGRPYVLAIGTLERRKNLPRLVEAFGHAAREVSDLRLVIAGRDGDDRGAIDRAIDEVGADVAARILLTRYVDDADRSWLVGNATVLAYPSLDEGFGFPLLDAMHARVPIVATRVGSIPEVAGDAALLADPADAAEIASHLVDAATSTETRSRLVAAGARQAAKFSWSDTARRMAALYRTLHEEAGTA